MLHLLFVNNRTTPAINFHLTRERGQEIFNRA